MINRRRGRLIAIEGIDGSGKTTLARAFAARLREAGRTVCESKEPTDGKWGTLIRASKTTQRLAPDDELAAFIEDRKEHVRDVINPALERGEVVVLDRYYYSTAAYQGWRVRAPEDIILMNEEFAPRPDLLVVLDMPATDAVGRIKARGDKPDLFEYPAALARIREVFLGFEGDHVLHLDGTRQVEQLIQEVESRFFEFDVRDFIERVRSKTGMTIEEITSGEKQQEAMADV
jgi:dTMP kinase